MSKPVKIILGVVLAIIAVAVLGSLVSAKPDVKVGESIDAPTTVSSTTTAPSTKAAVKPAPKAADTSVQTLTGTWDEDSWGVNMVATVKGGQIRIVQHIGDNSTSLEWVGTFPAVAKDHTVIVSQRNRSAMKDTISNYGKSTMKFRLDGDHLTFTSGGDSLATDHELHRK